MIVAIGEHPGLPATQARRVLQERLYNGPADPATMVARSDSDLVDKHLGRLVRMDIVDAGRESDDLTLIDGYRDMVATVPKELRDKSWIDGVVEDARRDVSENHVITGPEHSDLRHQVLAPQQLAAPHRHTKSIVAPPER